MLSHHISCCCTSCLTDFFFRTLLLILDCSNIQVIKTNWIPQEFTHIIFPQFASKLMQVNRSTSSLIMLFYQIWSFMKYCLLLKHFLILRTNIISARLKTNLKKTAGTWANSIHLSCGFPLTIIHLLVEIPCHCCVENCRSNELFQKKSKQAGWGHGNSKGRKSLCENSSGQLIFFF